jgi:hypothetical protein
MTGRARRIAGWFDPDASPEKLADRGRRFRDHVVNCSCPRCGNPRRSRLSKGWQKLTLQERRAKLD